MTFYHFKDSLKNFVIKIELRRLSPLFTIQDQQEDSITHNISEPEFDTWKFKWQEKAFSQNEEELYSDDRNCVTPQTKLYHQQIVEIRENGTRPNGRLFSYTNTDNFNDVITQLSPPILTDSNLNTRKTVSLKTTHIHGTNDNNSINNLPFKTMDIKPNTIMYLMADLRRKDVHYKDEKVVCTLTLIEEGVMYVLPDFSDKWVRIENSIGDTWDYKLTHDSEIPTRKDIEREENVLNEIFERQQTALSNAIGHEEFLKPEIQSEEVMYHIFGEISCCYGFTRSSVYVKYKLGLPATFTLLGGDIEECYTNQGSHPFSFSSSFTPQKINIGHLFDYKFKGLLNFAEQPALIKPIFSFEVNSLDRWGRHISLGYCSIVINLTPGIYTETVTTWQLAPRTKWEEMSEYFLGVTPVLGNLDSIRFPFEFSDQNLSKVGWKTRTSGNVEIKLYVIRQKFGGKKEVKLELQKREDVMESSARAIAAFQALRRKIKLDRPTS